MPNKMNFPTREERKKLLDELRELEKSQGRAFASSELYQNYINALNALDQKMEELYELRDMGIPKTVSADDKQKLLELLTAVGNAGEQFLGDCEEKKQDLNAGAPLLVRKMQGMLGRDYQTISRYNPEKPTFLSILQESSRTRTIDLRGKQIKTLGNMQSSRIPMSFRGPSGEMRSGVFTKASYVNLQEPFRQKVDQAKALCDQAGAEEIDSILSKAKAYHIRMKSPKDDGNRMNEKNVTDDFMVGYVLHRLRQIRRRNGSSKLTSSHVKEYFEKIGVDAKKIPKEAMTKLTEGLNSLQAQAGFAINGYALELRDKQRLDQRNTAMSAMADLLGAGSLLAKSTNMRFVDENGQITEGTFMDYGKGLDLTEDLETAKHLNSKPLNNKETLNQALRSIADLQILDAICLNVDRHQGNIMYQVDRKGNFIGVQGIDNDSSFGSRNLSDEEIMSLRVVSKSMADKLASMTPEMLKFSLRGRDLSERELKFAAERLETIKSAIQSGLIRTVPDQEFSKLSPKDYLPPKGSDNLFMQALNQVEQSARLVKDSMYGFVPYTGTVPELTPVSDDARKLTVGGLSDLGGKVSELLENKKTGFRVKDLTGIRGSSQEFKDMVESAQMVDHARTFLKENDKEAPDRNLLLLDDPRAQKSVKVYHNVFMNLREKTMDYLAKKMEERGAKTLEELAGKNGYEQKRIDYAKKLLAVTDEYLDGLNRELTPEQRKERSTLLGFHSLADRLEFRKHFIKKDEVPLEIGKNLVPNEQGNKQPEKEEGPVLQ